jgi:hypothetical protein
LVGYGLIGLEHGAGCGVVPKIIQEGAALELPLVAERRPVLPPVSKDLR